MILIDALYINNGGGKVLLDYLILELRKSNMEVHFLLDDRIVGNHPQIRPDRVEYLKGSFVKRHLFYLKNKNRFTKVLCFGNLPPSIKIDAEVLTYFHQPMYLDVPNGFSLVEELKFKFKIAVLRQISINTDFWLVQSDFIKKKMLLKFDFNPQNVKVLPFYPEFEPLHLTVVREKNTFIYVSNASPHKNHKILIEVFCDFYDQYAKGKLIVTVNDSYPEVVQFLNEKLNEGYPIENIGFVDRLTLQKKYLSSEFLIFPSLAESFGLGLIEAVECGCKVIGADLPYTYEVCKPTLVFNPLEKDSIFTAFENSLNCKNMKASLPRIQNNICQIISLLK